MEKILTDNASEKITVRWDGERFTISQLLKRKQSITVRIIIFNPREMFELVEFVKEVKC